MTEVKEFALGVGAGLISLVVSSLVAVSSFFLKNKIKEVDHRLNELEKWQIAAAILQGEFNQVKDELKEMREEMSKEQKVVRDDQRATLVMVSDLRNSLIRVNNEERRQCKK